jgi:hypothetical protein
MKYLESAILTMVPISFSVKSLMLIWNKLVSTTGRVGLEKRIYVVSFVIIPSMKILITFTNAEILVSDLITQGTSSTNKSINNESLDILSSDREIITKSKRVESRHSRKRKNVTQTVTKGCQVKKKKSIPPEDEAQSEEDINDNLDVLRLALHVALDEIIENLEEEGIINDTNQVIISTIIKQAHQKVINKLDTETMEK